MSKDKSNGEGNGYNKFSDRELQQDKTRQRFIARTKTGPEKAAAESKIARIEKVQKNRKDGKK